MVSPFLFPLIGTVNSISWTATFTTGSSSALPGDCCCLAYAKNVKVALVLQDAYTFNTAWYKDGLFQLVFGLGMGGADFNVENKWTEQLAPQVKRICS